VLDKTSSTLQARSVQAILGDFVGHRKRPLLILDNAKNLRTPGTVSARMAAAMSLSSLATGISFLLDDPERPESLRWEELRRVLDTSDEFFVYGFTWMLWAGWCRAEMPGNVRSILAAKRVSFVHSGGWKKMEKLRVDRATLEAALLSHVQPGSNVIDYYGLVEQAGVIYPLCEQGYRHVPVWADVLVRSPYDLRILQGEPGQLQLMNTLAYGAPYHSILTEDMGAIVAGACPCGRSGARFNLIGRMPGAELRGCANV
jgi:hypothetical protein